MPTEGGKFFFKAILNSFHIFQLIEARCFISYIKCYIFQKVSLSEAVYKINIILREHSILISFVLMTSAKKIHGHLDPLN